MSYNLDDINSWKKQEKTNDSKVYEANFRVIDEVVESGHIRSTPVIEFKSKHNKHRLQVIRLDYFTFNNFPELQEEFGEYYKSLYDGSMEDADKTVRNILIYHGFYKLKICKIASREQLNTVLSNLKTDLLVKVIKYLESKGCFQDWRKDTDKKEISIVNNVENDVKDKLFLDKLNKLEEENKKKDAQIQELIALMKSQQQKPVDTSITEDGPVDTSITEDGTETTEEDSQKINTEQE